MVKEESLIDIERSHVRRSDRVETHAAEGIVIGDWRHEGLAGIIKADEPAVKEMVHRWRKQ